MVLMNLRVSPTLEKLVSAFMGSRRAEADGEDTSVSGNNIGDEAGQIRSILL